MLEYYSIHIQNYCVFVCNMIDYGTYIGKILKFRDEHYKKKILKKFHCKNISGRKKKNIQVDKIKLLKLENNEYLFIQN